jgi:hypothetical protein
MKKFPFCRRAYDRVTGRIAGSGRHRPEFFTSSTGTHGRTAIDAECLAALQTVIPTLTPARTQEEGTPAAVSVPGLAENYRQAA